MLHSTVPRRLHPWSAPPAYVNACYVYMYGMRAPYVLSRLQVLGFQVDNYVADTDRLRSNEWAGVVVNQDKIQELVGGRAAWGDGGRGGELGAGSWDTCPLGSPWGVRGVGRMVVATDGPPPVAPLPPPHTNSHTPVHPQTCQAP